MDQGSAKYRQEFQAEADCLMQSLNEFMEGWIKVHMEYPRHFLMNVTAEVLQAVGLDIAVKSLTAEGKTKAEIMEILTNSVIMRLKLRDYPEQKSAAMNAEELKKFVDDSDTPGGELN